MNRKERLLSRLVNKYKLSTVNNLTEQIIVEMINELPYKLMLDSQKKKIISLDYEPGTFYISERAGHVNFLFDEPSQSFYEWFCSSIKGELQQLKKSNDFSTVLKQYGEQHLIEDVFVILFFNTYTGEKFWNIIPNQEYSDIFGRIILFLLYDDPNHEINTYVDFNRMGYRLIPNVLEKGEYSLKQRLIQSIYSGLIGMDIKDELAATSPLSREKIIPLAGNESDEEKINMIFGQLDEVAKFHDIDVSSWESFENCVVKCDSKTSLCWFTDDYIPTMFEMKFMEELLDCNRNIQITIIPRIQSYSNDASWRDVEDFLKLPVFRKLLKFTSEDRFSICKVGMAGGAFNGLKLSIECAEIVCNSDYVIIAGARSYEMGQGLLKHTFFTGIAICRTYSETVTGVCKNDGGIVFLEQLPGDKSFNGFRNRAYKRKYCKEHDRWFPVAELTASDYLKN